MKKTKLNEKIKYNDTKMINFGYVTKEDIKEHNPNRPQIPIHPYKIFITGGQDLEK